mgnify:CR=1 FL=1
MLHIEQQKKEREERKKERKNEKKERTSLNYTNTFGSLCFYRV